MEEVPLVSPENAWEVRKILVTNLDKATVEPDRVQQMVQLI